MAAGRIAGTCYISIDGQQYSLRGSMKVQPTTLKREGIAGLDGVHGFSEKPTVPFCEGEFSDMATLSLVALQAITNATVTIELANGTTYVGSNGWWAADGTIDADEGKVPFKFEFLQMVEDLA